MLPPKISQFLIGAGIFIGIMVACYFFGVYDEKQKQQIEIEKLKTQIEIFQNATAQTTEKVITKYKDRIVYVDKKESELIKTIPEVLKNESLACRLGPGFVGLHNNAVNANALSTATKIIDGATGTTVPNK